VIKESGPISDGRTRPERELERDLAINRLTDLARLAGASKEAIETWLRRGDPLSPASLATLASPAERAQSAKAVEAPLTAEDIADIEWARAVVVAHDSPPLSESTERTCRLLDRIVAKHRQ